MLLSWRKVVKKWRSDEIQSSVAFHFHFVRLSREFMLISVSSFLSLIILIWLLFLYKKKINEAKRKNEANKSVCAMLLFVCLFLFTCSYIRIFFFAVRDHSFVLFAFHVVKRRHFAREMEKVRLQCGRCNHFFGATNRRYIKLNEIYVAFEILYSNCYWMIYLFLNTVVSMSSKDERTLLLIIKQYKKKISTCFLYVSFKSKHYSGVPLIEVVCEIKYIRSCV